MLSHFFVRCFLLGAALLTSVPAPLFASQAGAPAANTAAATHAAGTVQSISGSDLTLRTDAGQLYTVHVRDGARLLQVPPNSKDLSAAQPFALTDIASGDRILVNGAAGDEPNSIAAIRIVLMKAQAISSLHAQEQADWQRRGSGGLVRFVDLPNHAIQITGSGHTVTILLQRATILRRYAPDSVAFESAVPGTLDQIHPGDQLRVRGDRSEDGATITADEIVSGSFLNVAGPVTAVNPDIGTLTVKDLTTRRSILVHTTPATTLRKLDGRISAFLAARANGGSSTAAPAAGAAPASSPRPRGDLTQMIQRLPAITLNDLHTGDAVMLVASAPDMAATSVTAITVVGGVEQILSATSKGGQVMQLSPFGSMGGSDMSEMGGGAGMP